MVNYNILKFIQFKGISSAWSTHLLIDSLSIFSGKYEVKPFSFVISKANIKKIDIIDEQKYNILGVRSYGVGCYINRSVNGSSLKMRVYQQAEVNHLFWCKVDTKNGAFGVVTSELAHSVASTNMTFAKIDADKINSNYLQLLFRSKLFNVYMDNMVVGSTNRKYIKPDDLLTDVYIPLPTLDEQKQLVAKYQVKVEFANDCEKHALELEQSIEAYLYSELNISFYFNKPANLSLLKFASFINLKEWSYNFLSDSNMLKSDYDLITLNCIIANFMTDSNGKSLTTMTSKEPDKNFIYIGMEDVDKNTGTVLNNKIVSGKEIKSATVQLPKNYFIYGKLRPYLNKYYFSESNDPNLVVSSEFFVFNIKSKINTEYFKLVLGSFIIQEQIKDAMKGARMPRITKDIFLNLVIPMPPLEIQNKIAEHITNIKNQIRELKKLAVDNRACAILNFEKAIFHNENH